MIVVSVRQLYDLVLSQNVSERVRGITLSVFQRVDWLSSPFSSLTFREYLSREPKKEIVLKEKVIREYIYQVPVSICTLGDVSKKQQKRDSLVKKIFTLSI